MPRISYDLVAVVMMVMTRKVVMMATMMMITLREAKMTVRATMRMMLTTMVVKFFRQTRPDCCPWKGLLSLLQR